MSSPGQQLDERHSVLAAKVEANAAKTDIALGEVWQAIDEIRAGNSDTVDIEPPADAETPDQEASYDFSDLAKFIGDTLESGEELTIYSLGIPENTDVWVHWFTVQPDGEWRLLQGETTSAKADRVRVTVPDLPGMRVLQLQVRGVTSNHAFVEIAEPKVEPDPGPMPETTPSNQPGTPSNPVPPPVVAPIQTPPPPTQQIGSATERAIAHWSVVPERQVLSKSFEIGVVAHHLDGIDHVAFSVDGGAWFRIDEPSINPRTSVEEYWFDLPVDRQGWRSVRAVAVPKQGMPHKLETMRVYMGENESLFPVYELGDGPQELRVRDLPDLGWLTIKPKPGAAPVITGRTRFWGPGNVKLQNVAIETHQGGGTFAGDHNETRMKRAWFDNVDWRGKPETWNLAVEFDQTIYDGCFIADTQNVWTKSGQMLVRNTVIDRVYEDVMRTTAGLFANVTVQNMDRGEFRGYHPDFLQARDAGNGILQDFTIEKNAGQGIFPENIRDMAFVRVNMNSTGSGAAIQMQGKTQNVLFEGGSFNGSVRLRGDRGFSIPDGERIVFNGVRVREKFLEELRETPRVEVR
ncbi:MAG: hypothetical protein AAGI37_17855 [Planctomycetota bacterium]